MELATMGDEYTKDSLQIARLEERMAAMTRDLCALTSQVGELHGQLNLVLTALAEAKGGWRTMMWLGGAAASAGGLISWALSHVQIKI